MFKIKEAIGIKITADNQAKLYSFDDRDCDDFGRMRLR